MRVVDLIRKKRDGGELSREELQFLVSGYTRGDIPDYQVSAWLMAAVLRGLSRAETANLTDVMLRSGEVLDLSDIAGPKVDKHSTGGVGDKTSLILAPIAAAGGLVVPMISGRGLGHTGGTLDKLESIPGFSVKLSLADFRRVLRQAGCGLIGQTSEIAPADKKLYALRDVTATVESRSLICASIMSKKLAEGVDALVLDVKTGDGAFMKTLEDSVALAELMVETGQRMGKRTMALITDMDQPLGRAIGNALEVAECIEVLRGGGPRDLSDLSLELTAWMFVLGGKSANVADGRALAEEQLRNGRALARFAEIVAAQGGDAKVVEDTMRLPRARNRVEVTSRESGFVARIACEQMGVASLVLGGGREKKEDDIDAAVGIVLHKKGGDPVRAGEALCTVHCNAQARLAESLAMIERSYVIAAEPPSPRPLVWKVIGV